MIRMKRLEVREVFSMAFNVVFFPALKLMCRYRMFVLRYFSILLVYSVKGMLHLYI